MDTYSQLIPGLQASAAEDFDRLMGNGMAAKCSEADIRPERFELSTLGSEDRCSDPLSYGRMLNQCLEFLQGQPCLTQNSPQGALGHFLVIWNSQSAMRRILVSEDYVAARLMIYTIAYLAQCLAEIFP